MLTRLDSMLLFRIPWIHWSIRISSRTLPWTVDLWRGLNTLPAAQPEEGTTNEISDSQPEAHPVPIITLDGRLMEGTTYLEHSVLGASLDSGLMEGTSSPEPLEQSVLNTLDPRKRNRRSVRLWRCNWTMDI